MGQVTVELNKRIYRLACGDGDEARLKELAGVVRGKVDHLVQQHGQIGDDRLLVMAAIMLADELRDQQEKAMRGAEAEDPADSAA